MRIWIAALLSMVCGLASAADRTEKIRELMEAQGLVEAFDQQIKAGREYTRQMADQMIDKMLSTLNPPAEFQAQFRDATRDFINAAQTPWTAQDIVDVWGKYYGAKFSDGELDELLKYYRSPLGQKDAVASREAMVQYRAEFQERYKPVMQKATDDFIKRLQEIGTKCNCKKVPTPTSWAPNGHKLEKRNVDQT